MGKPLCLVTGATGSVGPELVRHLYESGLAIRVVARRAPAEGVLPPEAEFCPGDIRNTAFLERAVAGARFVFHLAAKVHVPNPSSALRADYWELHVETTRRLVEACRAAGVERLVYFSSIGVYGPSRGATLDETTVPNPQSLYAESKLAGEEVVLSARRSSAEAPRAVVLRFAAIYGHRMRGNYALLVKALRLGLFLPLGNGQNRRTLVHESDAARAALLAARHPQAAGRIYNVSDGKIHLQREVIEAICAAMGRRPPRLSLPAQPARWLAAAADVAPKLLGHPFRLTAVVDKFLEDVAVGAERIRNELSFAPQMGLAEGWEQTMAALRAGRAASPVLSRSAAR